jgi:hypothetical protein
MIPVPAMGRSRVTGVPYTIERTDLAALLPGGSAPLDLICDGILKGSPFINFHED